MRLVGFLQLDGPFRAKVAGQLAEHRESIMGVAVETLGLLSVVHELNDAVFARHVPAVMAAYDKSHSAGFPVACIRA